MGTQTKAINRTSRKNKNKHVLPSVLIFISFLFLGSIHSTFAQTPSYSSRPFSDGEVLRYKVKWGFIRVGTVEITQQAVDSSFFPKYLVQLEAKSTKIKVVLHAHSPTNTDFMLEQSREKITVYKYDFPKNLILMEERQNGALVRRNGLSYNGDYYDLLGVIMMMRCLSASESRVVLPTIVDFRIKNTDLHFTDELEKIKVSAFNRPIQARRVEGKANWKGLADVSGPFKAWISDDDAAIPLKIKLKASLGSVSLELERIHRPDRRWTDENPRPAHVSSKEVLKQ